MPEVDGEKFAYDRKGIAAAKRAAKNKGVEVDYKNDGGIIGSTQRRRARQGASVVE